MAGSCLFGCDIPTVDDWHASICYICCAQLLADQSRLAAQPTKPTPAGHGGKGTLPGTGAGKGHSRLQAETGAPAGAGVAREAARAGERGQGRQGCWRGVKSSEGITVPTVYTTAYAGRYVGG